jgi:hypothetical protein
MFSREAIANTMIGVVTFFLVLCSLFHYTGVWYSQYLPMSDSGTYDNTGKPYDTQRILTADMTLNEEAYNSYSPLFIRYEGLCPTDKAGMLTSVARPLPCHMAFRLPLSRH